MNKMSIMKVIIIILFFVGLAFISFPFIKKSYLSYQIETVNIRESLNIPSNRVEMRDKIQPPTFREVVGLSNYETEGSIGKLMIPSVDLSVSLFPSLTNQNLLLGGVSVFPERQPKNQNMVFLSHHLRDNSLLFGPLLNVNASEYIYLQYLNDYYKYKITIKKIISEDLISVMENEDRAKITLITCDTSEWTDKRLIVQGELIEELTEKKDIQKVNQIIKNKKQTKSKFQLFLFKFSGIFIGLTISILIFVWLLQKI